MSSDDPVDKTAFSSDTEDDGDVDIDFDGVEIDGAREFANANDDPETLGEEPANLPGDAAGEDGDNAGESVNDEDEDLLDWDVTEVKPEPMSDLTGEDEPLGAYWDEAKFHYEAASESNKDKSEARIAAVEALEDECEWMCVRWPEDDEPLHDLRWYDEDAGEWRRDAGARITDRMVEKLGGKATDRECNHVHHFLAARNPVPASALDAADDDRVLIPVENGVLNLTDVEYDAETGYVDLSTVELLDDDPSFRFTYSIDTAWDPHGADIEGFDAWLQSITQSDEARRVLHEMTGHAIHPEYPVDAFLVCIGEPGSGKSQTLKVIKKMMGRSNTSGIGLQRLEGNRFAANDLVENRANIHMDLSGVKLQKMDSLKRASAGEGLVCEQKGIQGSREKPNKASMIFAADNPPAFPQSNRAFGRRLQVVEFPAKYVDDPDPENPLELQSRPKLKVEKELQAEDRLKTCLVHAVTGLVRLLNEGKFSGSKSWEERVEHYETFADPLAAFARAALERDPNGAVAASDVESAYDAFAELNHHPGKDRNTILQTVRNFTWTRMAKSRVRSWSVGDGKDTVYKGMSFTEFAKENLLPEEAHWGQYGGRPDGDDGDDIDAPDRTMVADLEPGRENVKVAVENVMDEPASWLEGQGVIRDESGSVRYKIPEGFTLEEGKTYVMKEVVVEPAEGDDVKVQLVAGMSEVILIDSGDRDDDQDTVTDDTNDDGGVVSDDEGESDSKVPQKDRVEALKNAVKRVGDGGKGAPTTCVKADLAKRHGIDPGTVEEEIRKLMMDGQLHEPTADHLRVV